MKNSVELFHTLVQYIIHLYSFIVLRKWQTTMYIVIKMKIKNEKEKTFNSKNKSKLQTDTVAQRKVKYEKKNKASSAN